MRGIGKMSDMHRVDQDSHEPMPSFVEQIQKKYHYMAGRTRRVADYILKNPRNVVYMSITELAEACEVSEPTITRLCRSIGLSGYQELKFTISKEMVNPLQNIYEDLSELDEITDIATKLSKSHMMSIEYTFKEMDWNQLNKAASAIEAADKLEFFGMGNAACVAQSARNKFMRLGLNANFLSDSHTQLMSASMLRKNDVALAISSSGSTKEMIDVLKAAKTGGATTVCLVGRPNAPLTKVADIKIVTSTPESFYRSESMENMIAQVFVIDILFIFAALRRKDVFLTNLEKTRKALTNRKI